MVHSSYLSKLDDSSIAYRSSTPTGRRFASDASINTNMLHDAIGDALDTASIISQRRKFNKVPTHRLSNQRQRVPTPIEEVEPTQSRPVSPLDDRTISYQDDNQYRTRDYSPSPYRRDVRSNERFNSTPPRDRYISPYLREKYNAPFQQDEFSHHQMRSKSAPNRRPLDNGRYSNFNNMRRDTYVESVNGISYDTSRRYTHRDISPRYSRDAGSVGGFTRRSRDTLMTFDVVNDAGNIKLRSRNQNQHLMQSEQTSLANPLYQVPPIPVMQHQQSPQKEEQKQIIINVNAAPPPSSSNASLPSTHLPVSQNYEDANEFSSVTSNPRSMRPSANVTRWKNKDVLFLPKDAVVSEASVTAAAMASLIAKSDSVCSIEKAVKCVSDILVSSDEGKDNVALMVKPSISYDDFYRLNDSSVIPISFKDVKKNVREAMRMKPNQTGLNTSNRYISATQFYARCALLAATAIMKANPDDKAFIAQRAAETIFIFHSRTMNDYTNWMQNADKSLKELSQSVSNAINDLPVYDSQSMASLASVAVLSEGGKWLALERVRVKAPKGADLETQLSDDLDEEAIISPIRNKGSLMDGLDDSDDSDVEENLNTYGNSFRGNNARGRSRTRSGSIDMASKSYNSNIPSIPRVPSLSLRTRAESMERPNSNNPPHRDNDHIKTAVQRLLTSPSEKNLEIKGVDVRAKMSSDLDRKQEEIAKRTQRIQVRAVESSGDEMDSTPARTFVGESNQTGDFNRKMNSRTYQPRKQINNQTKGFDLVDDMPSAKEIIEGIGAMMTPVTSYLKGIDTSSWSEKLKMPQCGMDTSDFQDEDFYSSDQEHQSKSPSDIPTMHSRPSEQRGTIDSSFYKQMSGLSHMNEYEIADKSISLDDITRDDDEDNDDKVMIQRSSSRSSFTSKNCNSSDTGGAFSAAVRDGDFSSVPMQKKLSLTPPGISNNDFLPTPPRSETSNEGENNNNSIGNNDYFAGPIGGKNDKVKRKMFSRFKRGS